MLFKEENMHPLIDELMERKKRLEKVISLAEEELRKAPEGRLRVTSCNGKWQYYWSAERENCVKRKYLSKEDEKIRNLLAQKDYLTDLVRVARKELARVESLLEPGYFLLPEHMYTAMHPARRPLINPYLINDKDDEELWRAKKYSPNPLFPEECKYPTKQGELVRTKSEVMIANMYYELGIPYKYECPIALKTGEVKYPDFTLLHVSSRRIFFHEHLGMMDEAGYRRDNIHKLELYSRSGIFSGKNLILTFESAGCPLNVHVLKQNIKEIFDC